MNHWKRAFATFGLTLALMCGAANSVAQVTDPPPLGATVPIPAGYLRTQTPPDWRGQTQQWYFGQASSIFSDMEQATQATLQGITLVDLNTGEILAQFTAAQLAAGAP
jgi:hypothetical protein